MRSATNLQYLHDQIANHVWAKARLRRFFPVAVRHGEGLLTERTADARACRYELALMEEQANWRSASGLAG